ncbi:hypothetical protein [uncultured Erythrobacter sp.]|uniref:DUF7668 domain-containing protein n=1 Tax=uncultured Erythrobacter sp. TaxID=263913 RepID=UPI00262513BD|nr:hypothetical protein [uncultured Erythrobacter sp.]
MELSDLASDDGEHLVPATWRSVFEDIVRAFSAGDFQLKESTIDFVAPIDEETAKHFEYCVASYGDIIVELDPKVWDQSIYARTFDGWQFLIDLTTRSEQVSDLVLHAKFDQATRLLELQSVHVP